MPNYSIISSQTINTATSTITFSSIPNTFTDLRLVIQAASSSSPDNCFVRFNGDTQNNYSRGWFFCNNASTSGGGQNNLISGIYNGDVLGTFTSTLIYDILNYKNTNTFKTGIIRCGNATSSSSAVDYNVFTWRKTPEAINTITITTANSANFLAGSTFHLYGISAASNSPKALGGVVSTDGLFWYHTFGTTQSFTPNTSITADILTIAGGGQGGGGNGAGGGAGGLVYLSSQSLTAQNYTVTIGAGGSGGVTNNRGGSGSNSQFGSLTAAIGGGGGGGFDTNSTGANGGSGGGGGSYSGTGGSLAGGTGSQGNNGGSGNTANLGAYPYHAGGGGGAGAVGGNGTTLVCGDGGIGASAYSSWGLATKTGQLSSGVYYYAGGGGGGGDKGSGTTTGGTGGLGGGGLGGTPTITAVVGTANTGGGGGGEGGGGAGANGGSGIVIVRYSVV